MPRNDITPDQLKLLYIDNTLSKKEIALMLKCNITTIHKKMIKFRIPSRKQRDSVRIAMQKKVIRISKVSLFNLYINKKLSIIETAKKMDCSPETIRRELIRNEINLRTKSEAIHFGKSKLTTPREVIKTLYYDSGLTQSQIAKKLGKSSGHIIHLMKKYNLLTRSPSITQLKYPKFGFSNNLIEKAYLMGFRAGDLHVISSPSGNYLRVDCTSTKNEQIQLFKTLFQKYGHVWIGKPREDGNRVCVVTLNHTFDFLLPKKDEIVSWITENKRYFFSFVAGYTDAEGCIGVFQGLARFTLASYDKNILKQIYEGFNKFGVPCNPPRILVKKGYIKSDGVIYRKDHWHLTLIRKSSLLLLFRELKPYLMHQKRIVDLKKAEENITARNNKLSISNMVVKTALCEI